MSIIHDKNSLKVIIQEYTRILKLAWYNYSQVVNITKCSKNWWNEEYQAKITAYR